jgi:hypothetical protein
LGAAFIFSEQLCYHLFKPSFLPPCLGRGNHLRRQRGHQFGTQTGGPVLRFLSDGGMVQCQGQQFQRAFPFTYLGQVVGQPGQGIQSDGLPLRSGF